MHEAEAPAQLHQMPPERATSCAHALPSLRTCVMAMKVETVRKKTEGRRQCTPSSHTLIPHPVGASAVRHPRSRRAKLWGRGMLTLQDTDKQLSKEAQPFQSPPVLAVYLYTDTHEHLRIHIYTCMHTCMHTWIYTMHTCIHTHIHTYTNTEWAQTYTYIQIHTYINIYIHINTHIYTHKYTYIY